MRSSRGIVLGLRLLHNGKGRPNPAGSLSGHLHQNTPRHPPLISKRPTLLQFSQRSLLVSSLGSQRFASTSAASNDAVAAIPTPTAADDAWAAAFNSTVEKAGGDIEPYVGYLKEMGVDFGWGPSSMIQWVLENIHVWSGMPWFGSIVVTVLAIRVAILRFNFQSADTVGRMATVAPQTQALQKQLTQARLAGDQQAMMLATQELKTLYKAAQIKPFRAFLPMLIQVPVGFGLWRVTRRMADIPVPGLEHGGIAWFTDLTIADPYMVLPGLTSIAMYLMFKRGGEMGSTATVNPGMLTFMKYGLPTMSFFVIMWAPASTQVVFLTGSIWAFIQGFLLSSNKVRQWAGIQPLPPKRTAETQSNQQAQPYKGTITMVRNSAGSYSAQESKEPAGPFANAKKEWRKITKTLKEKKEQKQVDAKKKRAIEYEKNRKQEEQLKKAQSGPRS